MKSGDSLQQAGGAIAEIRDGNAVQQTGGIAVLDVAPGFPQRRTPHNRVELCAEIGIALLSGSTKIRQAAAILSLPYVPYYTTHRTKVQ